MKKFVRIVKNFKCSKIMCSNFQILLLLTCFVVLSTQKKNDETVKAKNLLTATNKAKREAALADGSEFFGLADALKPKVHTRYSSQTPRLHSSNNFRMYDSLEGFRAGLDDFGHDKVETYIIKTEEDDEGRPSAVYKVFASDPNLVAQTFGNNFHREIKSHKSTGISSINKGKFIHTPPKSESNRGSPSFDVNQVKTRNFPLKNNNKGSLPAILIPYQKTLKGNAILYRQTNSSPTAPVEVQNVKPKQVQQFNAQTQATPVHNCNHNQAQGYTYAPPQSANAQPHQAIALSNQPPRFNGHSSNNNGQVYNQQQQQQQSQQQIKNAQNNNYNQQSNHNAQPLNPPQNNPQTKNVNQNQNNNAVPPNHQPNHAGTFNNQANNQGNQVDKGLYNNPFNGNNQQSYNNNNNNFANVLPPQALTHVLQGAVHNTPQGTVKYFNVAVTTNDHIPLPHNQAIPQNYLNSGINHNRNNQDENAKFLNGPAVFNGAHNSQNSADSLTMMKETGPSYGYGGSNGDLSASLDALSSFSQMPTDGYVDSGNNYEYPTATVTHLGAAESHDQVPTYAQGHKGLSHFSSQKPKQLNTDTIDSSKYSSEEQFKPSLFLGAINNAGPPTSDNYEYPDPSVLSQKGEYAAPVFETESPYANHRYQ